MKENENINVPEDISVVNSDLPGMEENGPILSIEIYDRSKYVSDGEKTYTYDEFMAKTASARAAGIDEDTIRSVYNLYQPGMEAYISTLFSEDVNMDLAKEAVNGILQNAWPAENEVIEESITKLRSFAGPEPEVNIGDIEIGEKLQFAEEVLGKEVMNEEELLFGEGARQNEEQMQEPEKKEGPLEEDILFHGAEIKEEAPQEDALNNPFEGGVAFNPFENQENQGYENVQDIKIEEEKAPEEKAPEEKAPEEKAPEENAAKEEPQQKSFEEMQAAMYAFEKARQEKELADELKAREAEVKAQPQGEEKEAKGKEAPKAPQPGEVELVREMDPQERQLHDMMADINAAGRVIDRKIENLEREKENQVLDQMLQDLENNELQNLDVDDAQFPGMEEIGDVQAQNIVNPFDGLNINDQIIQPEVKQEEVQPEVKQEEANIDVNAIIFDEDKDTFSPAELKAIEKDLGVMETTKANLVKSNEYFAKMKDNLPAERKEKFLKSLEDIGTSTTRTGTITSMFFIWAMGKKGYSVKDAIGLLDSPKFDTEHEDFQKFCEENPITRLQNDPVKYKEAMKNWAELGYNATQKMKEYRFPEIDYDSKEEFKKVSFEMQLVTSIGVDFNQEITQGIFETKNNEHIGYDIIKDTIGEDAFNDMTSFWIVNQELFSEFSNAHRNINKVTFWNSGDAERNKDIIVEFAENDYIMREKFKSFKGKPFGEVYEKNTVESWIKSFAMRDFTKYSDDYLNVPFEQVVDYLHGKNIEKFGASLMKEFKPYVEKTAPSFEKILKDGYGNLLTGESKNADLKDAFISIPDNDPKAMEDFLKTRTKDGSETYRTYVSNTVQSLCGEHNRFCLRQHNLQINDVILIDGKSANELWGQKYAHVKNETDRNILIRAEIVKAMYKGDHTISAKTFKVNKDYTTKVGEDTEIYPSREKAQKLADTTAVFNANINDIHATLENYKKRLAATMKNPDTIGAEQREGSKLFRQMTKALTECLEDYEKFNNPGEGVGIKEFRESLGRFHKAALDYYKERSTANNDRTATAFDALNNIPAMAKIYDQCKADIVGNKWLDAETNMSNPSLREINNYTKKVSGSFEKYNPLKQKSKEAAAAEQKQRKDLFVEQRMYTRKLIKASGRLADKNKHMSSEEVSRNVIFDKYLEFAFKKGITAEALKTARESLTSDNLKREAKELYNNSVFRGVARKHQGNAWEEWKKVEAKATTLQFKYKEDLKKLATIDGAEYILHYGNDPTKTEKADNLHEEMNAGNQPQRVQSAVQPNVEMRKAPLISEAKTAFEEIKVEDNYSRLGKVVATQILSVPRSRQLLQGVAAGQIKESEIIDACASHFRKQKYLEKNISLDKLMNDISSGKLAQTAVNKIVEPLKKASEAKVKKNIENERKQQKNAGKMTM